jgi:predicted GNAT family acetyltransferase
MVETAEQLVDNDFLRQFEIKTNGHLATIEYSLQERKIFLTKLTIPEEISDEAFRKEFIAAVFEQIQDRNLSVMPTCPVIAKFVRSNRKYKRMLPVGVRI